VSLKILIRSRIRDRGPMTVAEFMELALYHPVHGYYTSASRRSGREGDFFTNVDVGPLFGEILAAQLAELWPSLRGGGAARFDLVEVGASDGRLARDILDAAQREHPEVYDALRVTLVDRSNAAAAEQRRMLAPHAAQVIAGAAELPEAVTGAIVANELLDALPVHRVVMQHGELREIYVAEDGHGFCQVALPPSTPRIARFFSRLNVALPEGVLAEVGLAAMDWIADAAASLTRGYIILFDYGFEAGALYSPLHAAGTLTGFRAHTAGMERWLESPGTSDLTSDVNLTAIRAAAEDAGLVLLGMTDQTYFVTALDLVARLDEEQTVSSIQRRLAARTLLMPGGLGSTMKAIAFGKDVGAPVLRGFSAGRLT
jgi:SAM-dependent MidA family methyltransferase